MALPKLNVIIGIDKLLMKSHDMFQIILELINLLLNFVVVFCQWKIYACIKLIIFINWNKTKIKKNS